MKQTAILLLSVLCACTQLDDLTGTTLEQRCAYWRAAYAAAVAYREANPSKSADARLAAAEAALGICPPVSVPEAGK